MLRVDQNQLDNLLQEEVYETSVNIIPDLEEEIKQLQFDKNRLNMTLEAIQIEAHESAMDLQTKVKELQSENSQLKDIIVNITVLEKKQEHLRARCESREQEIIELEGVNKELLDKISNLENDLDTKNEIIKILKDSVSTGNCSDNVQPKTPTRLTRHAESLVMDLGLHTGTEPLQLVSSRIRSHRPTQYSLSNNRDLKKIMLLGDSHARGLALRLKPRIDSTMVIESVVKPGARLNKVICDVDKYLDSECVIVLGGTNDMGSSQVEHFSDRMEKLMRTVNKPLLIGNLPFRHDLPIWHKINEAIFYANKNLADLIDKYSHVMLLDLYSLPRAYHTNHGLHLNHKGKRAVCNMIADTLANKKIGHTIAKQESVSLTHSISHKLELPSNGQTNEESTASLTLTTSNLSDEQDVMAHQGSSGIENRDVSDCATCPPTPQMNLNHNNQDIASPSFLGFETPKTLGLVKDKTKQTDIKVTQDEDSLNSNTTNRSLVESSYFLRERKPSQKTS